MIMKTQKPILLLMLLVPLLLMIGCTRHVSRGLTPEGTVEQAVFPDDSQLVREGGSVPNPQNLRLLGAGLSKNKLRGLIGSPHFREGFAAREWDYLLHLRAADEQMVGCRFKVVFDKQMLARSLYWAPAQCAQLAIADAAPAAAAAAAAPEAASRQFSLSTDALFPYAKWSARDMSASGRERVRQIAAELRGASTLQVQLLGYTDRIGSDKANLTLSQRRADSVREVLVDAGIPAEAVMARGMGESRSVECDERLDRVDQVACMAPDRRVEVVAQGTI